MRCILFFAIITASAWAQPTMPQPTAPQMARAGDVLGPGNFLHVVADVDKAIDFYENVLGMDLQRAPDGSKAVTPRSYVNTPEIQNLYNAPGVPFRVATGMINESPMRAEFIEWNEAGRKPIQPRIQDPGATRMILMVRNLDAILARVRRTGTTVVTSGGSPMTLETSAGTRKMILLKDPDGFFVELIQPLPPPLDATRASNNIYSIGFGVTVSDLDKTLSVFKVALGFDPKVGMWTQDEKVASIAGLPAAETRSAEAAVPGSNLQIEFREFRNVGRKANESSLRDPGTPILRLHVRDIDTTLTKLFAAGIKVASKDEQYVTLNTNLNTNGNSVRLVILRGPDNLMIQLLQNVVPGN